MSGISLFPLAGMGEVAPGDDLAEHILGAMAAAGLVALALLGFPGSQLW